MSGTWPSRQAAGRHVTIFTFGTMLVGIAVMLVHRRNRRRRISAIDRWPDAAKRLESNATGHGNSRGD